MRGDSSKTSGTAILAAVRHRRREPSGGLGCAHRWPQLWHTRVLAHDKRQMQLRRRGTDGLSTPRWRGQSAANSSRKWSSQSQVFWDADGKMDPFPQAVGLSKRLVLFIFFECAFGPRRLIFPPIKESAARLGPNLFKTSGFLANYGSKAHDIGGLDRNDHSGVLWPAYPIQLRALAPRSASSSMQKRAPNPPTRDASPNASV